MNDPLVLIDLLVVAGAAVVLPVALGRWTAAWLAVPVSTAAAFSVGGKGPSRPRWRGDELAGVA